MEETSPDTLGQNVLQWDDHVDSRVSCADIPKRMTRSVKVDGCRFTIGMLDYLNVIPPYVIGWIIIGIYIWFLNMKHLPTSYRESFQEKRRKEVNDATFLFLTCTAVTHFLTTVHFCIIFQ